jgi:hypothetical protein
MWTAFEDMLTGGNNKIENCDVVLIEAPEEEATLVFGNRFKLSPRTSTCKCCGYDFSISEDVLLLKYSARPRVKIIPGWSITEDERTGDPWWAR